MNRKFSVATFVAASVAVCLARPLVAEQQIIYLNGVPAGTPPNTAVTVSATYSTRPLDESLTGLGLRLHWDSRQLTLIGVEQRLLQGLAAEGVVEADVHDLDGDVDTDTFLHLAWADRHGEWPGPGTTPVSLEDVQFLTSPTFAGPARLHLSASSTPPDWVLVPATIFADGFESGDFSRWDDLVGPAGPLPFALDPALPPGAALIELLGRLAGPLPDLGTLGFPLLDVDGDGTLGVATDGRLILRHLFGFAGDPLIADAVGPGATRTTAAEIRAYLLDLEPGLDVDLDGRRDALTDGLLIVRFLAGFSGQALVDGVLGPDATRTDPQEIADFLGILADPDGGGDSDGDGVSDLDEVVGYPILIDFDASGTPTPRWVTSDPFLPDTDGDGLDDRRERLVRTDPRDEDTDLDDLTDLDELDHYASAPASVDTDGDSRGPDGTGVPNPLFFDGNELAIFGTSPALADTDGDARSDFEEANQNATPPLIADVPRLSVELVGDVDVELEYTSTVSQETRMLASTLTGRSDTAGQSNTDTTSSQWSIGASTTVTAGVEAGFPGGATASASVSATISGEYSEETTTSFTEDSSTTTQNEFQESQETAVTNSEEVTGGTLTTGIKIRNLGDVAFTLSDIGITALLRDPDDRKSFRIVATLIPQLPGGEIVLGPFNGETGVLQVADDDLPTGLATSLLADPAGLILDVATFSLEDAEGRNFAFLAEVTNARTALVTLDFGDGEVERYRVATLVERNPDGTGAGVTMEKVLTDFVHVPYETQPRTGSTDPEFPDGVEVLTRVRDVATAIDPDPANYSNAFWAVLSNDPDLTGASGEPFTTDFGDLTLYSGDTLSLVYVHDDDRDGLFRREEFLYGTVDAPLDLDGDGDVDATDLARTVDFDLDGLGEFFEVRTGWQVTVDGLAPRRVHPDPTRADADRDGVDDLAEFRGRDGCGPYDPADPNQPDPSCLGTDSGDATDPNTSDTDADGLSDLADDDPLSSFNPPPVLSAISFNLSPSSILTVSGPVTDSRDGIDRVTIEWDDGSVPDVVLGPGCPIGDTCPPYPALDLDATHQYLQAGTYVVVVTARDRLPLPFRAESERTYVATVDFPGDEEARYLFTGGSLADGTVHGHDGTAGGGEPPQVAVDRFGSAGDAYCMTGDQLDVCGYIELDALPLGSQLTLTTWVVPFGLEGHLVGQHDYARLTFQFNESDVRFEIDDGAVASFVEDPGTPSTQTACGTLADSALWTFYAATVAYDGTDTTLRLYRGSGTDSAVSLIDEEVVAGHQFTNPNPATHAFIGGTDAPSGPDDECNRSYRGRIDDSRVYNRALSIAEINALLNEVH